MLRIDFCNALCSRHCMDRITHGIGGCEAYLRSTYARCDGLAPLALARLGGWAVVMYSLMNSSEH